jgi:hypothetical protein
LPAAKEWDLYKEDDLKQSPSPEKPCDVPVWVLARDARYVLARRGSLDEGREAFDRLLDAIEGFAVSHGADIEAGVNLARRAAYTRMRAHGYKAITQGVAIHRPHGDGFNRVDVYAIDDRRQKQANSIAPFFVIDLAI